MAKPISRQKAQRDTSIFASATPKNARLSSAQRRDRGGHGGIASWHADKQICRAAAAPTSLRLLLSSHKAAMVPKLASSRKLDIRGPPPKSWSRKEGGKGEWTNERHRDCIPPVCPLPLSPRPNFLPQLVSRGDFKRGMKFGQPAATACSGGENVHGEEKKLAGRNSLNSRNDRRRRPGVRGSSARCIRRKSNGILEPRGRGTDVRVRASPVRPTERERVALRESWRTAHMAFGVRTRGKEKF